MTCMTQILFNKELEAIVRGGRVHVLSVRSLLHVFIVVRTITVGVASLGGIRMKK